MKILDESYGATSWYYDFGEENEQNDIFTDREPNYIYTNAGNYTIIQIVAMNIIAMIQLIIMLL